MVAAGGEGPTCVLGHRRLRIIDLSDAPTSRCANEDGSVMVTFNGEIYNFRELRARARGGRHTFRSSGDTEVDRARLRGVRRRRRRRGSTACSRSRSGTAPRAGCCWRATAWARSRSTTARRGGGSRSRPRSRRCARCPWVRAEPDLGALPELLVFGYVPTPADDLRATSASCRRRRVLTVDAGGACADRSDTGEPRVPGRAGSRAGLRRGRRSASASSCAPRCDEGSWPTCRSARCSPAGSTLGGRGADGRDSASRSRPSRSASTRPRYDERRYARPVAERFGTEHHGVRAFVPDAAALAGALVVGHHDEPFADSSMIPTYLICEGRARARHGRAHRRRRRRDVRRVRALRGRARRSPRATSGAWSVARGRQCAARHRLVLRDAQQGPAVQRRSGRNAGATVSGMGVDLRSRGGTLGARSRAPSGARRRLRLVRPRRGGRRRRSAAAPAHGGEPAGPTCWTTCS